MEPTIQEKMKTYVGLKAQEKAITAELDKLKPDILAYLGKLKVDKLPTSLGTFSVATKATWKYSEAVDNLQEKEKATGVAEQVVNYYVKFTAAKEPKSNE